MSDRFTLLTLSLSLILQNVCSSDFRVSEPLEHTLHENGSITVTCEYENHTSWEWEAKLKMNSTEVVCEVQKNKNEKCKWTHENNKFKFTLMKLEARHKDQVFSCIISKVMPLPIKTREGQGVKLFQGHNIPFPPPTRVCSCPTPASAVNCPSDTSSPGNTYTLVICGMIVAVVVLSLYSLILTGVYIRLRITKAESSDTLIYVPMQRKVKPNDMDNTEYVDMREVQKQEGHIRDVNYNC